MGVSLASPHRSGSFAGSLASEPRGDLSGVSSPAARRSSLGERATRLPRGMPCINRAGTITDRGPQACEGYAGINATRRASQTQEVPQAGDPVFPAGLHSGRIGGDHEDTFDRPDTSLPIQTRGRLAVDLGGFAGLPCNPSGKQQMTVDSNLFAHLVHVTPNEAGYAPLELSEMPRCERNRGLNWKPQVNGMDHLGTDLGTDAQVNRLKKSCSDTAGLPSYNTDEYKAKARKRAAAAAAAVVESAASQAGSESRSPRRRARSATPYAGRRAFEVEPLRSTSRPRRDEAAMTADVAGKSSKALVAFRRSTRAVAVPGAGQWWPQRGPEELESFRRRDLYAGDEERSRRKFCELLDAHAARASQAPQASPRGRSASRAPRAQSLPPRGPRGHDHHWGVRSHRVYADPPTVVHAPVAAGMMARAATLSAGHTSKAMADHRASRFYQDRSRRLCLPAKTRPF